MLSEPAPSHISITAVAGRLQDPQGTSIFISQATTHSNSFSAGELMGGPKEQMPLHIKLKPSRASLNQTLVQPWLYFPLWEVTFGVGETQEKSATMLSKVILEPRLSWLFPKGKTSGQANL